MEDIVYERLKEYIKRRSKMYYEIIETSKGVSNEVAKHIALELDHLLKYAEIQENVEIEQMAKEVIEK